MARVLLAGAVLATAARSEEDCDYHGRVTCSSAGLLELERCGESCFFCDKEEVPGNRSAYSCEEARIPGLGLECDGSVVIVTNCSTGTSFRRGASGHCYDVVNEAGCDPECDCSCYEDGYPCGGTNDLSSPCDPNRCGPGTALYVGRYCFDGGTGCDNFGCDLVGDEAGPCCESTDELIPNSECNAPFDPGPSCSCDCYESAYACGLGDGDDSRCEPEVCGDAAPACYDGGNGCDNFGCDSEGDEAGPCCEEDSEPQPQTECQTADECDCSCYENAYACGLDDNSDSRCDAACGGLDQFGSASCFNPCDDRGCDLGDGAGPCCAPDDPFQAQDCGESGSSSKKSNSSASTTVVVVVVVCVGVVLLLALGGVLVGKRHVKKNLEKYPTVEGVPAANVGATAESKANEDHEEAIALKLATVEMTAAAVPEATATTI